MSARMDVIVIGGGLSGLSAAKLLLEQGLKVIVLEARDRVGGRTYTIQRENMSYVDLGGAFFGPKHNRLLCLAKEFGVKTVLTNSDGDRAFYKQGKTHRFRGDFPPMGNLLAYLDLNNLFRLMDKMGKEIPRASPWKAPNAAKLDNMTIQEFCDKHVWTNSVRRFLHLFVNVIMASEPYEVSLLSLLWYVSLCGGVDQIFFVANDGQELTFVGGSQQISNRMAEKIDKVLLNHAAFHVQQDETSVTVQCINGQEFHASYVIVATPLPLHSKLTHDPPLPSLRNQLIQRIPMGSSIKTIMCYKEPFWRENGFCGSSAIDDDDAIISFTLDDVQLDGTNPALIGFILADNARKYVEMTTEERKIKISQLYCKVFESEEALHPVYYKEMNWLGEQWTGGAYASMMPPGFLTKFGKEIRKPVGRLYFAGTETATEWSGFMEGAIQAGERSAREILCQMGKIREDEIWQDEPENDEVAHGLVSTFWKRNLPSVPGFLKIMGLMWFSSVAVAGTYLYHRYGAKK